MRFGLGVARETRCLKVVRSLLQLAYFVYAISKSPGEVMRTCRLVGDFAIRKVIRTVISCADQFIVLIFHCGPLF